MQNSKALRARELLRTSALHQAKSKEYIELSIKLASTSFSQTAMAMKNKGWEAAQKRKEALEEAAEVIGLDLEPGVLPDLLERRIEDALALVDTIEWSRDHYGY